MILGLDISTSITGYTILDETTGKVLVCSHIVLKDLNSLFQKAEKAKNVFEKEVFQKYNIKKVFIESSLLSFAGGKSSASVIATLTKFNGIISYIIEKDFAIVPKFLMATSARKEIGIKILKGIKGTKTKKAKEQVMDHILLYEKWYKPLYKKTGTIKDHCYDEIDSFVIAKAGFVLGIKGINKQSESR